MPGMQDPQLSATPVTAVTPRRRPAVTSYLVLAFGIGWSLLAVPLLTRLPVEPFLLGLVYVALLGSALVVSRWVDGRGAARRLLSRAVAWRFGPGRWLVVVLAVPATTVLLAAVSGTLQDSGRSWLASAGFYLFDIVVFGALVLNLAEETAWGGFMQSRLMARHGLLVASLLTAPAFAAIHVPLLFEEGWTWPEVARGLALLFGLAPIYRYLLGLHLLGTSGSVLAIAVQHASWNTATRLDEVRGEWQAIVAVLLVTALVALHHRLRGRSAGPRGRKAEKAAAAGWLVPSARVPA